MTNTILVLAAHPDDEILGCGGTIARHIAEGDKVYVHFMTDGVGARGENPQASQQRHTAAQAAADLLGISQLIFSNFPDNRMDSVPLLDIVKEIESSIQKISANIIYTHFSGDLNIDHQITHRAVMTACRPVSHCPVKAIYSFEVLSSTEWSHSMGEQAFIPNYIVAIDNYIQKKEAALQCYHQELREAPHSRSSEAIINLAKHRGQTHGFGFAEAFMVQRIVM